jgi:hypothetical protein
MARGKTLMRQIAQVLMASSRAPMVRVSFIRIAHSRDQRLVPQSLSGDYGRLLRLVSRVCYRLVVLIFQLIIADWSVMAFRLRFNICVRHNSPSVRLIFGRRGKPFKWHIYPAAEKTQDACRDRSFLSRCVNQNGWRPDKRAKLKQGCFSIPLGCPRLRPSASTCWHRWRRRSPSRSLRRSGQLRHRRSRAA